MSITADLVQRIIVDHDRGRPRSRQKSIGPSEIGTACSRKLLYQVLQVPEVSEPAVSLAAYVGTGVHSQMEQALADDPDWHTEMRVSVPIGDSHHLAGTLDAYHLPSASVVDWKTVGPSSLAKYKRRTPDHYRMQVAVYGLGAVLAGLPVQTTALVYIPRNGQLGEIHVDAHPWDQELAEKAIIRYESLLAVGQAGTDALPLMPTADGPCSWCPWWKPNSQDLTTGCPGHPPTSPRGELPPWDIEEKEKAHV